MAIAAGIGEPRHWLGRVSSETYLASLSLRYLLAAQDEGGEVLAGRALAALRTFVDDVGSTTAREDWIDDDDDITHRHLRHQGARTCHRFVD